MILIVTIQYLLIIKFGTVLCLEQCVILMFSHHMETIASSFSCFVSHLIFIYRKLSWPGRSHNSTPTYYPTLSCKNPFENLSFFRRSFAVSQMTLVVFFLIFMFDLLPVFDAVLPDFGEVYGFIGSLFDPNVTGHLQKLKRMDPINVETVNTCQRAFFLSTILSDYSSRLCNLLFRCYCWWETWLSI